MRADICAELLMQQRGDDEQLAHGLGGAAGLADDVKAGLLHVDDIQQRGHAFRVDVVFHKEAGAIALFTRQIIVVQVVERLLYGGWAERAAADAEHHEVVKLFADLRRVRQDRLHDLILIIRQFTPAHDRALCAHAGDRAVHLRLHDLQLTTIKPAVAELIGHHVVKVQLNAHGLAPGFVCISFHHSRCLPLVLRLIIIQRAGVICIK
ncbi:hypothetical protein SDC9_119576 [bioreactor metagenome]|uniref:Uncharacterized protein n=1 Tax=bioreactor metagenome TaxID=1076179 RepID=A0A645C4A2_9ZZZZ